MKKVISIDGLTKFVGGMHDHFQKMVAHHGALHELHKGHATDHQAQADALDDGDVSKTFHTKAAAFHTNKANLHKAMHEHMQGCMKAYGADGDVLKAIFVDEGSAPAAGAAAPPAAAVVKCAHEKAMTEACTDCKRDATTQNSIEAMVKETTTALTQKALQTLDTDETIKNTIKEMVLKGVQEALGNKIVPDGIQRTIPQPISLVPRVGAPDRNLMNDLDPEVATIFGDI